MQNNLPLNWCECKLEDFCYINLGQSPSSDTYNNDKKGIPFFQGKADFGKTYPTVRCWCSSPNKIAEEGDVLLSVRAPVGAVNIANEKCCIGRGLAALRGVDAIKNKFMYYLILAYERELHKQETGTTFAAITGNTLKNIDILLPPLAEQERIVEKIEALFQDIDEGVERLKSAQAQIKQYRQSVLKSAFKGKLYKTTDWKEVSFKDLLASDKYSMKRGPFGSSLKKEYFTNHGIRVFEQYNPINNDPYWKRYYITKEKYEELKAFEAKAGDLLISCSGATLGRIVELPKDVETGIINQALLKLTLNNKKVINSYFIHLFRSPMFQQKIFSQARGAAIQNMLSVSEIKKIPLYLPSLPEQQHIVEEIEKRFAVADELEKAVNEGLEKADKLKQSILKKAFEGKLVAQNPNDEPASVLLNRIKKSPPHERQEKC